MNISNLVTLKDEDLEDAFAWVDWRENDSEVAALFSEQIGSSDKIRITEGSDLVLSYEGKSHIVPLTYSGSDRYVVLSSCAELVKRTHDTFLYKKSLENDTHGFLVIPKSFSKELASKYKNWFSEHLEPLKLGYDYFNEVDIPYINHDEKLASFVNNDPKDRLLERWSHQESVSKKSIGNVFKSLALDFAKNVLLPLFAIAVGALLVTMFLQIIKAGSF